MRIIDRMIKGSLTRLFPSLIREVVLELDSNKSYILVLPEDLSGEDVDNAFRQFKANKNPVNLVIIRSDMVRLIELGGKEK